MEIDLAGESLAFIIVGSRFRLPPRSPHDFKDLAGISARKLAETFGPFPHPSFKIGEKARQPEPAVCSRTLN